MAYIRTELDEGEREEFYRLKKIQHKKEIIRAKAALERLKWEEHQAELMLAEGRPVKQIDFEPPNLMDEVRDVDLLF